MFRGDLWGQVSILYTSILSILILVLPFAERTSRITLKSFDLFSISLFFIPLFVGISSGNSINRIFVQGVPILLFFCKIIAIRSLLNRLPIPYSIKFIKGFFRSFSFFVFIFSIFNLLLSYSLFRLGIIMYYQAHTDFTILIATFIANNNYSLLLTSTIIAFLSGKRMALVSSIVMILSLLLANLSDELPC